MSSEHKLTSGRLYRYSIQCSNQIFGHLVRICETPAFHAPARGASFVYRKNRRGPSPRPAWRSHCLHTARHLLWVGSSRKPQLIGRHVGERAYILPMTRARHIFYGWCLIDELLKLCLLMSSLRFSILPPLLGKRFASITPWGGTGRSRFDIIRLDGA